VLACLAGLRGGRPGPAAHALADLVHRRDLAQASEALNRCGARRAAKTERVYVWGREWRVSAWASEAAPPGRPAD
jgi:hypothetical protein